MRWSRGRKRLFKIPISLGSWKGVQFRERTGCCQGPGQGRGQRPGKEQILERESQGWRRDGLEGSQAASQPWQRPRGSSGLLCPRREAQLCREAWIFAVRLVCFWVVHRGRDFT